MDNSGSPSSSTQVKVETSVNNSTQGPPQEKNAWVKYLGAEVIIVLLVLSGVALFIFKPFGLFGPHLPQTVPAAMNTNIAPNGQKIESTPPLAPPKITIISITKSGFEPQDASTSGKNIMLQFQNNTLTPAEVEFVDSQIPTQKVAPNVLSNPISVSQSSTTFHLKSDPSKNGSLIIN